jgi:hypothetical protein
MKKVLKVAVLTMVSLPTLTAVFLFTGNNNLDRSVIAVLDSIDVNIKEDCMNLPNSTVLYCP